MIELIESLPSPRLQRGVTHSWMRETSVVDGDALVMMMAMILSKIPVPAGCQNGVSGSESWFLVAAVERNSFWKTIEPPRFLGRKATYRRRGRPRGCLGWMHPPRRDQCGPAPSMGVSPQAPSPSHLLAPWIFW